MYYWVHYEALGILQWIRQRPCPHGFSVLDEAEAGEKLSSEGGSACVYKTVLGPLVWLQG